MSRQEMKAAQPFLQEPVSEVIPRGSQKETFAESVLKKARLASVECSYRPNHTIPPTSNLAERVQRGLGNLWY
ncbi:hypothetical protein GN244_ATG04356 [Phytophthora infestans]|nr:hypothetical protein GN244_ATG04356 [Phytophthora infestans]